MRAIDGDMADFMATQLADASQTFVVADLRRFLMIEGHSADRIDEALEGWWDSFFATGPDGVMLTPAGKDIVRRLNDPV